MADPSDSWELVSAEQTEHIKTIEEDVKKLTRLFSEYANVQMAFETKINERLSEMEKKISNVKASVNVVSEATDQVAKELEESSSALLEAMYDMKMAKLEEGALTTF